MKSIREYNTTGMNLHEREVLFNKVIPIEIDAIVWYSGDCWSYPEPVNVTKDNQKRITMFWNSLFFETKEEAEKKNAIAKGNYGSYMMGVW